MFSLVNLALRRGPNLLFSNASVTVHDGERVGLVGANGTGKSSLFALLLGQLQADSGECRLSPGQVLAHVAQETPNDSRPALDHVLDGDDELRRIERALHEAEAAGDGEQLGLLHGRLESIGGYGAPARAARLLHGLGFAPGEEILPVDSFSGGWRVRLNLAQALMCRSDMLLLDEPTNHLDLDAVLWLQGWLLDYPGTLMLISHDREFLDAVCGRILHLEQQQLNDYSGNYSEFERQRSLRLAQQTAARDKQQREIAHIRNFVDRFRAKATKARQAQSRLKALERMEVIAAAHVDSQFSFRFLPPAKVPNPLLKLHDASVGYGDSPVLGNLRMDLKPGDRIGLLGPNGAGKSTLVRLLAGKLPPLSGDRLPAQDLRIGYFAQHQLEQLDPQASPLLHLQRLDADATDQALRDFLGGFGFSGDMALTPVAPFSGGEKARLALALIVYTRPNLLLLDEPTNHLDLEMRQALVSALQDFPGALLVIAHDRHLIRSTTDRLLLVTGGGLHEFDGDLDDYARWLANRRGREQGSMAAPTETSRTDPRERRQAAARLRQQLAPARRAVQKLEQDVERLTAEKHALEKRLADPWLYEDANTDRLLDLLRDQGKLETRLQETEEAWMTALDRLETLEARNGGEKDGWTSNA